MLLSYARRIRPSRLSASQTVVLLLTLLATGAHPSTAAEAEKIFQTPIVAADLDNAAYTQWSSGEESPANRSGAPTPASLVWTPTNGLGFFQGPYGESKVPGVRYLRVGWKTPQLVGSVLVCGGGSMSVLKPTATYPGKISDDSQWTPAQRVLGTSVTTAEVTSNEFALWVLPPGTRTQALRFSHTPKLTDTIYGGNLSGVYIMSARLSNVAPWSQVLAGNLEGRSLLVNNANDGWGAWANMTIDPKPLERSEPVSKEHPEWITLSWPAPVKLRGLNLLSPGFTAARALVFEGSDKADLTSADAGSWRSVAVNEATDLQYPRNLVPNWLDFGETVTTRAVRLLITKPMNEAGIHPHLAGKTRKGARVYLVELQALQPLGDAPLEAPAAPKAAALPHPPIAIPFTLAKPGFVTLVIEGMSGKRVRNLVSNTYFPAGANTAWWDGTDDLGRDVDAARHGLYKIPAQFVQPGMYKVRGLVHDALDLRYEFNVYSAGKPAWNTADRTGSWLSNHTPPQSALYVPAESSPAGKPAVLLGSFVSEGRDGLAWVGLDGRKQGGKTWVGGIWTGAPYLARDIGATPVKEYYAYAGVPWEGELRLTALASNGSEKSILATPWKFPGTTDAERKANSDDRSLGGLAARNGILAVSLPKLNQILLVDVKAGTVAGTLNATAPRGIAYDANGNLLVLSGASVQRFGARDGLNFSAVESVATSDLVEPVGLALDKTGNIYVSDQGSSHQVKVFDNAGKFLRAIGHAGTPLPGPYDALHMNHPEGLTIDSEDHLWVAEKDYYPKRVSVWTLDGKLVTAYYGPSEYGGGGRLDSTDKTRFYYGGMEFKLDWAKGDYSLLNVLYRDDFEGGFNLPKGSGPPEQPLYRNGTRYFTNCYNSNPTNGFGTTFIFKETGGIARPVAAAGRANEWDALKTDAFKPQWPTGADPKGDFWAGNGKNMVFFLWTDANGDSKPQPSEVTTKQGMSGGMTVMPDMSLCVSRLNEKAMRLAPIGFNSSGVPQYDLSKGQVLAEGVQGGMSSGGDQLLTGENNLTVVTLGLKPFSPYSVSGARNGVAQWSYPDPWPGLHASHEAATPDRPGQIIGTTRVLGGFIKPPGSDVGELWAVNGNMGNIYLFTSEGLFVDTFFEDVRTGSLWAMPVALRNMRVNGLTLHDENFWPSMTQTSDGKVYLVDGANSCLVRVDGLETLKRLPDATLRVSKEDLTAAQTYQISAEAQRQNAGVSGPLTVTTLAAAPQLDGKMDEWAGASWVDIDKRGQGANFNSNSKPYDISASVVISGDRLYAGYRTANANLLENSGENPIAPFKTGGALDLMLGTDPNADPKRANPVVGAIRLLVTKVKGKTLAVLYRAVVPGTTTPVPFSSPWRTIKLDQVTDISSEVQLAGSDGNYEFSVPLATLGLKPVPGTTLKGDLGILRGDSGQTTARIYWSNKATAIVSDVPSEAQLTPNLWGNWKF